MQDDLDTYDKVIKFSKALIILSIAIFFVRCSFGSFVPDVDIHGLEDGDEIKIEVFEGEDHKSIIIHKNDKEIVID